LLICARCDLALSWDSLQRALSRCVEEGGAEIDRKGRHPGHSCDPSLLIQRRVETRVWKKGDGELAPMSKFSICKHEAAAAMGPYDISPEPRFQFHRLSAC
jgi:hypothetical protein